MQLDCRGIRRTSAAAAALLWVGTASADLGAFKIDALSIPTTDHQLLVGAACVTSMLWMLGKLAAVGRECYRIGYVAGLRARQDEPREGKVIPLPLGAAAGDDYWDSRDKRASACSRDV